jgi:hypothetical protein
MKCLRYQRCTNDRIRVPGLLALLAMTKLMFRKGLLRHKGFLAMSGHIIDAMMLSAPKQRNTLAETEALRECVGAFFRSGS